MRISIPYTRPRLRPGPLFPAVLAALVSLVWTGPAPATTWTLPLTITNGGAVVQSLELGIHPQGTYGVDSQLGEVGLPPWPPAAVFDARFMITGCEGLRLDLRDDTMTERVHLIQWQPGEGGYPVTVRWNKAALPPATFTISDGYTGTLILPFDMATVDSLRIPGAQSYIKRLRITVLPGSVPPEPPVITPSVPNLTVFVGQRFPDLRLDDHVSDPDTPDAGLQWNVVGDGPPWLTIGTDHVLRVESPDEWAGTSVFTLRVVDPDGLEDLQEITLSAVPAGLPDWVRTLTVVNDGGQSQGCVIGLDPDGTDGLDAALGEVALPPWPPSAVFDTRMLFPDEITPSRRDIRAGDGATKDFHLQWQAGTGGYPVTVSWPADLPPGDLQISDEFGGTFVPPLDMTSTQSLVVPESLSFVTGLLVTVQAAIDTTPPQGPAGLRLVSQVPNVSVRLDWSGWPCVEENFGYYEVLFDTLAFTDHATFAWDWSEDPALAQALTTQTTVSLPAAASGYVFRIRAWDAFGNAGPVSSPCHVGAVAGVPQDEAAPGPGGSLDNVPNPFNPLTTIRFTLPREATVDLDIFDLTGRRIRRLFSGAAKAGPQKVSWDGRSEDGVTAPDGVYFCRLAGNGLLLTRKLTLMR